MALPDFAPLKEVPELLKLSEQAAAAPRGMIQKYLLSTLRNACAGYSGFYAKRLATVRIRLPILLPRITFDHGRP